jgi:hypothetical protein
LLRQGINALLPELFESPGIPESFRNQDCCAKGSTPCSLSFSSRPAFLLVTTLIVLSWFAIDYSSGQD